ncbi:MAG: MFS transporter [Deltaproteobacteria bacterium]|nr:MFS transporter [Deltaproteobacteria bacterium]
MGRPAGAQGRGPLFQALRSRNYRIFFLGQGLSCVGTWMQQVAAGWLLYRMTGSPFLLGAAAFAGQVPTFFMAPIAGVLADRWDRKLLLLTTQVVSLAQALALGLLALSGAVRVWHVLALGVVLGLATAFEVTLRHSFVVDLVEEREDLGNAIALNSTLVNVARLAGPAAAGVLISLWGEGACFLLNALSYVPMIAALLALRVKTRTRPKEALHPLRALREGFEYTFRFVPIRTLVILLSLVAFLGMPHSVFLPVFAKEVLGGGPRTLGFLSGASGAGALGGSLYLARRGGVLGLGRVVAVATALFGGGLVLFAVSRQLWVSMACLAAVGFGLMVHLAAGNTMAQAVMDDDKRGRVTSFFVVAFVGMTPLGSLLGGALAHLVGAPAVVGVGGAACVASAAWFAARRRAIREIVRPFYARAGIVPEEGSGICDIPGLSPPRDP